jgi:hypothetical protein
MGDLADRPEFVAGLLCGLAALVLGVGVAVAGRDRRPLAIAGALFAGASLVGMALTVGVRSELALGLWARLALAAAVVAGGFLLGDFDARWRRRGLGPVLLAVSAGGIFLTVPDTEQALVALGAALPLALLGWPRPLAWTGRAGAYAATGVLLWVVATGSAGRGSAVVGGVACLGLFVVEPLARLLDPGRGSVLEWLPAGRWGVAVAALAQLALVLVAARVAGLRASAAAAGAIALLEFAGAAALSLSASIVRRRTRW